MSELVGECLCRDKELCGSRNTSDNKDGLFEINISPSQGPMDL